MHGASNDVFYLTTAVLFYVVHFIRPLSPNFLSNYKHN
jgi:hypothetical protein